MATQQAFSPEEWTLLRLAPTLASAGIAAAEPSGIFGSIKEATAGARGMMEALQQNKSLELFAALGADRSTPALPDPKSILGEGNREQQMANFKAHVLDRIKQAGQLVASKGSAAEASAYKAMIVSAAEKAANASTEGGFLGFGGTRVSSAEQSFINEVKTALGLSA